MTPFGDTLSIRVVVTECNHLMIRAMSLPPFYNHIWEVFYYLMYVTEIEEILQVTQKLKRYRDKRSNKKKENIGGKDGSPYRNITLSIKYM